MFRSLDRGQLVFAEGDIVAGFYLVVEGKVRIYKLAPSGAQQTLRIAEPGQLFAEAAIFSGGSYPAYAEMITNGKLSLFPKDDFLGLLHSNPDLSLHLLRAQSQLLYNLNRLVEDLSLKEVSARLAKYLGDYALRRKLRRFDLDISKTVLATRLGASSETISRTLARFVKAEALSVEGKTLEILNPELLQRIAAGEKV